VESTAGEPAIATGNFEADTLKRWRRLEGWDAN
jgi:hypothetical protein